VVEDNIMMMMIMICRPPFIKYDIVRLNGMVRGPVNPIGGIAGGVVLSESEECVNE
jgi:hypothetical protein